MQEKNERQIFKKWNLLKQNLHFASTNLPVSEGEIWWCGMGKNIGVEINGKNEQFSRPILVFKKLSHISFLGIPLSSQKHIGTWYISFRFQNKDEVAVLSQIKVISTSRLYTRMGEISKKDFTQIRDGFRKLYLE